MIQPMQTDHHTPPVAPPAPIPAANAARPNFDASRALDRAVAHARDWLDGVDTRSVASTVDHATLQSRMPSAMPRTGVDAVQVIDELVAIARDGLLGSASGRFYAWVIGGALPSTLGADLLTTVWDQNAGMFACSPAASVVEERAGEWLKEAFDLPRDASFAFTTGCQLAHVTALAAARYAVLAKAGWNITDGGVFGAPRIRVLTSVERHGSVDRALRLLGFGSRDMIGLPITDDGKLAPETLERALREGSGPTIVVLTAADLNIAAFDDFATLIPIAHAAGAWVHVDGAFGLFARASRSKSHLAVGIELADSWATDCHKWLNVPYDSGVAIVRDAEAHRASMTITASYLAANGAARDQIDWNPEFSRRARGFSVYAALRELGRDGLEAMVNRCCAHCHAIVTGIGALPGAELVRASELNQGVVRFPDSSPGATEADHDRRTNATIAAINAGGEAFFSGTTWRGRRAMRVSVVNWRTNEDDVRRSIAAAAAAIRSLST